MLLLKLTIIFNKAYSIHLHYAIFTSQTILGKDKRLIESF